jgi:nucleotide-binding universal stress UspA family protein
MTAVSEATAPTPVEQHERTILIGYDGSPRSEDGLALGRLLAEVLGARPVVVDVVLVPDHLLPVKERDLIADDWATDRLAVARDRLDALDPRVGAVVDDSAAHALNQLAESRDSLVVVLGPTHRSPMGRVFLGSVGQSMLSGGPCAVAVAPRGFAQRSQHRLRRIGAAVDGSAESWSAFAAARSLAERAHGTLSAISVSARPRYGYGGGISGPIAGLTIADYERAEDERATGVLDDAERRVPDGLAFERVLLEGLPERELGEAGAQLDLLLVGSRGYGPARRVLLGSVSVKLMHSARCPLLALPRQAGDDPLRLRVNR